MENILQQIDKLIDLIDELEDPSKLAEAREYLVNLYNKLESNK